MTRIYVDTSAVAKLFIAETETQDLRTWLGAKSGIQLISSALLSVELIRLLALVQPETVDSAGRFLAEAVDIVEVTPMMLNAAATVGPPRLRTLDAIHLATALDLADTVDILLSYDKLLLQSAANAGLVVASPGMVGHLKG